MPKYTLLVSKSLVLKTHQAKARHAYRSGTGHTVLDTPSGEPNASLVQVELTPEQFSVIRDADVFANENGQTPEIQLTEYAIEE